MIRALFIAAALGTVAAQAPGARAHPEPIFEWLNSSTTVSAVLTGPSSVQCGTAMKFTYTLQNPSTVSRTFLVTDTPLDTFMSADVFQFSGSATWEYMGMIAKKELVIKEEDMITIPAHGEVSKTINLNQYYACKPGANITVQAEHTLWEVLAANRVSGIEVRTNPKVFNCFGVPQPVELLPYTKTSTQRWYYDFRNAEGNQQRAHFSTAQCTHRQVQLLARPVANAFDMTMCEIDTRKDARNLFKNNRRLPAKAVSVFMASHSLFKTGKFVLDCKQGPEIQRRQSRDASNLYAFVYPAYTGEHRIFLCPQFWRAVHGGVRNENVDTMGGTLIHESTHFRDIGDTDDKCYMCCNCPRGGLSQSQALRNADSFEYVAERCRCPRGVCRHSMGVEMTIPQEVPEEPSTSMTSSTMATGLLGVTSGAMVTILGSYRLQRRSRTIMEEPILG